MSDDIVYFLTPDGQKVSNDPRWLRENDATAREEMLAARPNTGNVGVPRDEQAAQSGPKQLAKLQSGQPGVGENAVPDDTSHYTDPAATGKFTRAGQDEQARLAQLPEGAIPPMPEVEVEDSNERVLKARKEREEARERALKAQADLGEEGPGDPEKPYTEWSGKQLKAEVLRRNADRPDEEKIQTKGVRKGSELAKLLQEDDDNRGEQ